MMNLAAVPRRMARLQYAAVRLPLTLLQERVARYWDQDALVRLSLERFLGSLDGVAGWLLADDEISRRGQALRRRTGLPAEAGAPAARAQVRGAQHAEGEAPAGHAAGKRAAQQPEMPAWPAAEAGTVDVTFALPAQVGADSVALCGEFNEWSAESIRLERGGDGSWRVTVALEPGRSYRYRYLLDGERWENAWQADRYVPNSYGSTDSVVVVE